MVFKSIIFFSRSRGPDEFWRKRRFFRLSAHFKGRFRNCYSLTVRAVHRSLQFVTQSRDPKREYIKQIWKTRIEAGCLEQSINLKGLKEGLTRCSIHLDHKSLAELAVWEPRTFKSIVKIACERLKQDGLKYITNFKTSDLISRVVK